MPPREPLAIAGAGCRFPGGANDPQSFWELLRDGVDAIVEVPAERWNAARFHHANAAAPGRMVTRWGGFVENAAGFDAAFFGIAPREAARMDPQHRWLAEVAWEAIEDAGLRPERLDGTRTGVFLGMSSSDYPLLHRREMLSIDGYSNIGNCLSIAANRLSFLLNLRGPSLVVDTACSSSLVALHLAAQSLWRGECDYALVGGANALLSPESSIGFSQAHMLSPGGRCRAFDAAADGYVRSEGAAVVLLLPLRTAQALGLRVRARLLATASNQDGHSSSLTVPSQHAQQDLMREALEAAGVQARDVVYVEAHGTGTPVGDPVEARSLAAVFGDAQPPGGRVMIGSVKTNIGHLEPASGLAGLIKAMLVLEHRSVPPHLHLTTPDPQLPLDRLEIPTSLTPLPATADGGEPLVAVNSFGFGGANAHALLAPAPACAAAAESAEGPCIFPLSARSPAALADYAAACARLIASDATFSLRDICARAALGKAHHPIRTALVADSLADLRNRLEIFAGKASRVRPATAAPKIAFVFCGQGQQMRAMGRQLHEREPVFRAVWDQCDAISRRLGGPALLESLFAGEADSRLDHTHVAQPVLFAIQAGLVELWRSWGIDADYTIGHSVGEAAAAWAAGAYELEEILRVVLCRSRLQEQTRGRGRMLTAAMSVDDAVRWEAHFAGRIALAAINTPQQVTLAGEGAALEEIAVSLQAAEVFHRFLPTDYAFHSREMDPVEAGLRSDLAGVTGRDARVKFVSTVTGGIVRGSALDADYWWRNVRQTVRFAVGIELLLKEGCTVFVEIGPHPVVSPAVTEIALSRKIAITCVPSLRRREDESITMRRGLAALYQQGANVRWEVLYQPPARPVRLPTYPWQRQRLWHESATAASELRAPAPHPLLGQRQPHPQPTWLNHLDARLLPWLADHRPGGAAVLPATAYLEMAAAAVGEFLGDPAIFLEDIRFHRLLFLPDEKPVATCVRLDPARAKFEIFSASADAWELHAEGVYRPARLRQPPPADLDHLRATLTAERDPAGIYRELDEVGQIYGPAFRALTAARCNADEVLSEITASADSDLQGYRLYPPLLDACFHAGVALERHREKDSHVVVAAIRQVRVFQPLPENFCSHVRFTDRQRGESTMDLAVHGPSGAVLAELTGITVRAIDARRDRSGKRVFFELAWEPAPALPPACESTGEILLLAHEGGFGESVAITLRALQIPAVRVVAGSACVKRGEEDFEIDPARPDWAHWLWERLAERGALPARVLYLAGKADAEGCCGGFLAFAQARLAHLDGANPQRWLVVTRQAQWVTGDASISPEQAALWGMVRTAQTERPDWRISLVDCDDGELLPRELHTDEIEPEVAWREGARWVRRLRRREFESVAPAASEAACAPAYALHAGQPGRVDSLRFRGRPRPEPARGEVEIEIAAAGLNFRDVMKTLGIYPLRPGEAATLGDEFSGRITRTGRGVRRFKPGDVVVGFAPEGGAFGSHLVLPADAVWTMGARLSAVEAASIPVAFGTAYHALHTLARLRRGETVLIHAAAGGVGLAAVQLALRLGAIVLATAGSEDKRAHLRSLGVAHVMDSRTLDFADETLRLTGGRGVDVVLNSLAGAFQHKSLAVCAPHARFVEIGKRDLFEDNPLPLAAFRRSLSFFTFDLGSVLASRGAEQRALHRFLARGIAGGKLQPLPCTTFPACEAADAFRLMQSAQHIGKIVLEFDAARAPTLPAEFWPRTGATYLITGGLSGFGLATARWLAERGAAHLALVSRRGRPSAEDESRLADIRARGVHVAMLSADVADARSLARALRTLDRTMPPLRGVFHAAMVLHDCTLAELTRETLASVLAPKVAGTMNLHRLTLGRPLDCFVLFSSLSAVLGAPGQANYAAANAFLDALAQQRRAQGLPALSVHWSQIADVGVAARRTEISRHLTALGVQAMSAEESLAALPRLLVSEIAQAGIFEVDWEKLSRLSGKVATSAIFRDLVNEARAQPHPEQAANQWRESLHKMPPEGQVAAVAEMIVAQLAATLGTAPAEIDRARPLTELGLDSLMAVELKARLEGHLACELPIALFNADLTAARLAERLASQLGTTAPVAKPPRVKAAPAQPRAAEHSADFRIEPVPLSDLIRAGTMPPLAAAALMPWQAIMLDRLPFSPKAFFQRMSGGRVSLEFVIETALGPVGIFMLPLTTAQVAPGQPALLTHVLDGISQATECGARCVSLTGLIPSATNYGATVQAAYGGRADWAPATTGHATTVAAVVLNLEALLSAAGRELRDESVLSCGIGSIGLSALRLMLDVLPHPRELRLHDPYRSAQFFQELEADLRREHGYRGTIRVVRRVGDFLSEGGVIVGATNVENVMDVARLAPGTLIVDDSWPHCMNGPAALARFAGSRDILFTEGGFVRSEKAMPRIAHLPPEMAAAIPPESLRLLTALNPHDLTACILSALLSAHRPELAPTIGLIPPEAARQHWTALAELGFGAAELNYEGTPLAADAVTAFRQRYGKPAPASHPLAPT